MSKSPQATPANEPGHNHEACIDRALQNARRICHERGLRLTRQRRRVLELVWNSHRPVGAYDILDRLNRDGGNTAPPTVYRALEFLIGADLVHRLDSLNAYIGCPDPGSPHSGQFLICRACRSVAELDDRHINELVDRTASAHGFTAIDKTLEIRGLCRACR